MYLRKMAIVLLFCLHFSVELSKKLVHLEESQTVDLISNFGKQMVLRQSAAEYVGSDKEWMAIGLTLFPHSRKRYFITQKTDVFCVFICIPLQPSGY